MATLTTVEQEWVVFEKVVFRNFVPSSCRREETRKSFYAGACAMLSMVHRVGDLDVSKGDGCQYLDDLMQELLAFACECEIVRKHEELS